jgi:peptidoglycan/LPS O-acetylase OafA/YrhL
LYFIGQILLAVAAAYSVYKVIEDHMDRKFEELKQWMRENSDGNPASRTKLPDGQD